MKHVEPLFGRPIELLDSLTLTNWKKSLHTRFFALGVPGNKTEQYKSFAIKPLLNKNYTYMPSKQRKVATNENILTLKDGVVTTKPKCIDILFDLQDDIDMEHYDALYYLSHLLPPHIIVLSISCDMDFTIAHSINKEESLLAYRLFIKIAPDCHVNVVETFATDGS